MRREAQVAVLALVVAACATSDGSETTIVPSTSTTVPSDVSTTPPTIEPECPESVDFVEEGRVLRFDQPESDSSTVGLVVWDQSEGCERIEIGFETLQGAPATTPPNVTVRFMESLQILRVEVSADDTIIIDQTVETPLVDRMFVVKRLDAGSFIDFHLNVPVRARARVSHSPAKITIDLQPGTQSFLGVASVSNTAVMITPFDNGIEPKNVEVSGYALVTSGEVTVLATSGGRVVAEDTIVVSGSASRWSEYQTRLDVEVGDTTVFAGEPNSEGRLEGVTVGIQVR